MEQIKVNMIPNNEVKTIHCSKGDGNTRKWGFELYKEDGAIDASSISPQMFFDSYKGGTEQILPENTSNPTTSPIIADIQYPDSLRSEQTFLYRESPTTVDGQAKITRIKGNTVVFNQLVQNGNFADTSIWATNNSSLTVSNNIGAFVASAYDGRIRNRTETNVKSNHKYLQLVTIRASTDNIPISIGIAENQIFASNYRNYTIGGTFQTISYLWNTNFGDAGLIYMDILNKQSSNFATIYVKDVMIIDLTQLNNSAITDAQSFRSYYNLPYYDYTQGKLLPFLGEELKTTGKNLLPSQVLSSLNNGVTVTESNGVYTLNGTATGYGQAISTSTIFLLKGSYALLKNASSLDGHSTVQIRSLDGVTVYAISATGASLFTLTENTEVKFRITVETGFGQYSNYTIKPQLEFGSTATGFEPYTSSTINLPTLTYFPTGMKSAGAIYDETTESKAISRVGGITFNGSENWSQGNPATRFFIEGQFNFVPNSNGFASNGWTVITAYYGGLDGVWVQALTNGTRINLFADGLNITNLTAFKNYLNNNPLTVYLPLATPTEESITTASLVTEKGESPLYYDDELIADCNETISSESGIFDAKIKLMDDETVYSQKIQLHVERKP